MLTAMTVQAMYSTMADSNASHSLPSTIGPNTSLHSLHAGHISSSAPYIPTNDGRLCLCRVSSKGGQHHLFDLHHPSPQNPSFKSNSHCSLLTIQNATTAVKNPTILTITHPTLLSICLFTRPLLDFLRLSLAWRAESLMESCSQSMEVNEEYQTRIPFVFTSVSTSSGESSAEGGKLEVS